MCTVTSVDQLRNYTVVSMRRKVEVTRYSVYLKCTLHPAPFLLLNVFDYSLVYLLISHSLAINKKITFI